VEALTLADTMVVLEGGAVRQVGAPGEIYARPADLFVATFVGTPRMNTIRGRASGQRFVAEDLRLSAAPPVPDGTELVLGIRPEDVELLPAGGAPPGDLIPAEVVLVESLGAHALLTLRAGGVVLRALAAPGAAQGPLAVRLPADRRHWFSAAGQRLPG
jgi:ABC-type sugar transport system ATPase subunit